MDSFPLPIFIHFLTKPFYETVNKADLGENEGLRIRNVCEREVSQIERESEKSLRSKVVTGPWKELSRPEHFFPLPSSGQDTNKKRKPFFGSEFSRKKPEVQSQQRISLHETVCIVGQNCHSQTRVVSIAISLGSKSSYSKCAQTDMTPLDAPILWRQERRTLSFAPVLILFACTSPREKERKRFSLSFTSYFFSFLSPT